MVVSPNIHLKLGVWGSRLLVVPCGLAQLGTFSNDFSVAPTYQLINFKLNGDFFLGRGQWFRNFHSFPFFRQLSKIIPQHLSCHEQFVGPSTKDLKIFHFVTLGDMFGDLVSPSKTLREDCHKLGSPSHLRYTPPKTNECPLKKGLFQFEIHCNH